MSWLGSILGQREAPPPVEVLLERVQASIKVEDRKKAIQDLKSIASENRSAIGKAVPTLIGLLKTDREEMDHVRDILEILVAIMTCTSGKDNTTELQITENFVQDANNVAIVLGLLEDKDYYLRYYTTQLVNTLLSNKSAGLQDAILRSPMGMLRLMDLLADQRDLIRNEALLLLLELTQTNQEIQKIVAFEGAFEKLLDIIRDEGSAEGGIIVQDCLKLINNLLRGNASNQNYFRESNCIKRVPPLLEVQNSDMWVLTDNKFAIIVLALDLISLLVNGSNSSYSCQTVLAQNNVITLIVRLALGKMSSATIRCKSLYTLGDLIRAHPDNLSAFSAMALLNETSKQTQPSLMRLVLVLLNSKDLAERLAALHTFQCYLVSNEEGQLALASTITPPPITEEGIEENPVSSMSGTISIGGYLLRALLGWINSPNPDAISAWLASCVISAIIKDNNSSKELLLRIPLEIPKQGSPLTTLMTKSMRSLSQADRIDPLIKVGLLRMLCIWLDQSPTSVKSFLSTQGNLLFLVDVVQQPTPAPPSPAPHVQGLAALMIGLCFQYNEDDAKTEFNKDALYGIIKHRIGVDKYMAKLDQFRKTEDFTFAEQVITDKEPSVRYYDYDFTVFFKDAVDKFARPIKTGNYHKKPPHPPSTTGTHININNTNNNNNTLSPTLISRPPNSNSPVPAEHQDAVLNSYKDLVRMQDRELGTIKAELNSLQTLVSQKDAEIVNLREELLLVKNQPPSTHSNGALAAHSAEQDRIVATLTQAYNQLEEAVSKKDDEIAALTRQLGHLPVPSFLEDTDNTPSASALFEDPTTTNLRQQVSKLQEENKSLQAKLTSSPAPPTEENNRLTERINQLTQQYAQLQQENAELASTCTNLKNEHAQLASASPSQRSPQNSDPQLEQLRTQNAQYEAQLQQYHNHNVQLDAHVQHITGQLHQFSASHQQLSAYNNQLTTQIQQAQQHIHTLEASLREKDKEAGKRSPMPNADTGLRITKLEMLLKDEETKYKALVKEQEELLQLLANTEIENNNLKERLNILEAK